VADEGVPLYNLREMLESLATINGFTVASGRMDRIVLLPQIANYIQCQHAPAGGEPAVGDLAQNARMAVRRQTAYRYATDGWLDAILIDPGVEKRLSGTDRGRMGVGELLALETELATKAGKWTDDNRDSGKQLALLTAVEARAQVRDIVRSAFPELPVFGYQEPPDDLSIKPVSRLEDSETPENWIQLESELAERDEEIERETLGKLSDASSNPLLSNLAQLTADVSKTAARRERLQKAFDENDKEYLTHELDRMEARISSRPSTVPGQSADFTDTMGDLLQRLAKRPS
jgi:hypothetical protein